LTIESLAVEELIVGIGGQMIGTHGGDIKLLVGDFQVIGLAANIG